MSFHRHLAVSHVNATAAAAAAAAAAVGSYRTSLVCQEAWNLQVMQSLMGFYVQNMQNMQSVQNMQQNIPVAQMTNPAIWLQYLWCLLQLQ